MESRVYYSKSMQLQSLLSQSLPPKMPLAEVMRVSPEDQAIYDDVCFEPETESYWNKERLKGTKLFCL